MLPSASTTEGAIDIGPDLSLGGEGERFGHILARADKRATDDDPVCHHIEERTVYRTDASYLTEHLRVRIPALNAAPVVLLATRAAGADLFGRALPGPPIRRNRPPPSSSRR
jgi:hypothetical protein